METRDWNLLRAAASRARDLAPDQSVRLLVDAAGGLIAPPAAINPGGRAPGGHPELSWRGGRWTLSLSEKASALVDLYLPICAACPASPLTVGHLGQSLDGNVATAGGDSDFVTGPGNILHLHRMRALCDAVVVGAGTARTDNPRLTTRLCVGKNPVRVVLDPARRLPETLTLFSDDAAPTLLVTADGLPGGRRHGHAEVITVPSRDGRLDLAKLLDKLRSRNLHSVFVEGGGITVSNFLEAGLIDRLQVAVAPILTGHGRPGLRISARQAIADCLRPPHRLFSMGDDVLFDCDLRADRSAPVDAAATIRLNRIS